MHSTEVQMQAYKSTAEKDNAPFSESAPVWVWILCLLVLVVLFMGCDFQAAEATAYAEQEAHQRHDEALLGWVKYRPAATPIRASDLGATLTVCQQQSAREWLCFAK